MNYEIRYVRGHVEVYDQMGRFRSAPDPVGAAREERPPPPPDSTQNTRRARICRPRLPI